MEQDDLLQIYFSEADELLQTVEQSVMALESDPQNTDVVYELFRAVHTMKSSAAMVGFTQLSEHAHRLENLLEKLRNQQLPVTPSLVSFLLENHDLIKSMVENLAQGKHGAEAGVIEAMGQKANRFLGLDAPPQKEAIPKEDQRPVVDQNKSYYEVRICLRKDVFDTGQDPLMLLYELGDLGEIVSVETDASSLPPFLDMDPYELYLTWRVVVKTPKPLAAIEQVFIFIKEDKLNRVTIDDVSPHFREGVDTRLAAKPLGELLIDHNLVSKDDLEGVLSQQKKVGEVLVEEGKISENDLAKIVDLQEQSRVVVRKSTVRVGTDKLDHLANMVDEMTVQLAHVFAAAQSVPSTYTKKLRGELDTLGRVSRDVQGQVMRLRMFPIEGTFQRFQRMARDLAREQRKQVRVVMGGSETELDKDVIENISDPLKHLVRNCVDHGLESPEEREQLGKPPEGTITFQAYQQEGQIYIEICDDGRGIDANAVRQKAIKLGLITEDDKSQPEDLYHYLFLSGFSTAKEVSSVSGRGVGMDVVRSNIQRLGGTISISSAKGRGTTFIIKLPLTLAVIEGMYIRVRSETFVIPLSSVFSAAKLKKGDLKTIEGKGETVRFGDGYAPLVGLDRILGTGDKKETDREPLVVFVSGEKKVLGLVIDEILDQQQVVIKNVEKNFRKIPAVAGGVIMPDGNVAMIIDIHGLDHLFYERGRLEHQLH